MKRTPLRRISKKLAAKNREYRKVKAEWIQIHPFCEIGPILKKAGHPVQCKRLTDHPHHVRGRTGALLCDTKHWLASCKGECHPSFLHNNPSIARHLGLLA